MIQISIVIGLLICHLLGDYTHLSTAWMLNAKRLGTPLHPILCHASVHGILMSIFLLFMGVDIILVGKLFIFQVVTHFLIDVWKGKMNVWFPSLQSPMNKEHWIIFGVDQTLHMLVILTMAYML